MSDQSPGALDEVRRRKRVVWVLVGLVIAGAVLVVVGPILIGALVMGGAWIAALLYARTSDSIKRGNRIRLSVLVGLATLDLIIGVLILSSPVAGHGLDPLVVTAHRSWSTRGEHPMLVYWAWANLVCALLVLAPLFRGMQDLDVP